MKNIRLLACMFTHSDATVRGAYIVRMKDALGARLATARRMEEMGFERVDAQELDAVTSDGRTILRTADASWALRPDVHAKQLAEAFEDAKKAQPEPETKSVVGSESLSGIACPKCGDTLQHTSVCPSCAAGKLGYRHRYACVCGGGDLISKDKL